ncbi:MAG: hypothetical protein WDN31_18785 [Hyphomicrobium sp.]
MTSEQIIDRTKKDGLHGHLNSFKWVENEAQYDATAAQIRRETEDKEILAGVRVAWHSCVYGCRHRRDVPSLIPVGAGANVVRSGLSATARVAAGAAANAALSEAGLQASQETRTPPKRACRTSVLPLCSARALVLPSILSSRRERPSASKRT